MERTPSNFNIVKVSEKKKIIIIIPGHQRDHRNSIFNARTQKEPLFTMDPQKKKKKRKEKQKTSMTSGKIEKIPIDGPTQRIKTSIVEKISLHPPPALTREFLPAFPFHPPPHSSTKESYRQCHSFRARLPLMLPKKK